MTSEWWQRVEEVFASLRARPAQERAAFLEASCADDSAMRREVEALLAADDRPNGAFDQVVSSVAAAWAADGAPSLVGQQIGRYQVIAALGSGGMGEVYLTQDTTLDRRVALKFLPRQFTQDRDRLRRFEQEARAASALNHPNIITIYEVGEWEGARFIATEYVEGKTLGEQMQNPDRPLSLILDIGIQVAGALAAAHAAGIVHRDIKPANIMLRADGYIKVLDFGLAKLTSKRADLDVTDPGRVMGTISYMSPEQAMGQELDHRTDVFSLGVVLYEIATGHRLFSGESEAETYDCILNQEPPPMRDFDPTLPVELDQVIRRALQKEAGRRYQSAAELRTDLKRLAQGSEQTEAAKAVALARRAEHRSRFRRLAAATALVLTFAAALFFAGKNTVPPRSAAAPNEIPRKSIAVLPFVDRSQAKDQEYFSDGVAEEILNALAQVKDLKVAGRSSSFSFKGKSEDLRAIGTALGVAHLLEGSVRRQGGKMRITAQLVQTSDGFQLWSESYEGELSDVFKLQERIARAITDQLKVVLQGEQKSRLVTAPTSNTEAYSLYLQATAIFNRRESARFPEAISQLEDAVRLDPNFARAHARAALIHSLAPVYDARLRASAAAATVREVGLAKELDPTLAEPGAALGQMLLNQRRFGESRAAYEQALALDPDDINTGFWLAIAKNSNGYVKASAEGMDTILAKDPMFPNALHWRGRAYQQMGELDQAERILRRAADAGLPHVGLVLSEVEQARGRKTEAIEWLARGMQSFLHDFPAGSARLIAEGIHGGSAEREKALALIDQYLAGQPAIISGAAPFALICLGQPARGLALAQDKPTSNDSFVFPFLWSPPGRSARMLPEFSEFVRRSGLAALWDMHGPPDQCRKNDKGDYVCE